MKPPLDFGWQSAVLVGTLYLELAAKLEAVSKLIPKAAAKASIITINHPQIGKPSNSFLKMFSIDLLDTIPRFYIGNGYAVNGFNVCPQNAVPSF